MVSSTVENGKKRKRDDENEVCFLVVALEELFPSVSIYFFVSSYFISYSFGQQNSRTLLENYYDVEINLGSNV